MRGRCIKAAPLHRSARPLPTPAKVFRYKDGGIYGSKWGLLGSEELGGGYRANFRLQTAFDSSNGKFGLGGAPGEVDEFGQYASAGLAGPFGQVNLGRQIVPMYYAMADTDVRGGRYFGIIFTAWIGANTAARLGRRQHERTNRRAL